MCRIISVTLGRPVALHDEDIDVSLPTAFDIDQLSLEELLNGITTPDLQYTSPFLQVIGIRRLAGKILQSIHCANQDLPPGDKYAIRQKLHDELEAWKADIPKIGGPPCSEEERPTSSFRSSMWYEVPYHNAVLLLYRPSSAFPHPQALIQGETGSSAKILGQTLSSAKSVIHLYAELYRTGRLNYSWITLHAIFIAGLSYIYAISRIIKDHVWSGSDFPACLEYTRIIDDTGACSNVLVAICERWGTPRGSCEIFDQLSTAIIEDAVKASLSLPRSNPTPPECTESARNVPNDPSRSDSNNISLQMHHEASSTPRQQQQDDPFVYLDCDEHVALPSSLPESNQPSAEVGFRQFYQNLQGGLPKSLPQYHGDIPSEVIMGFSQDWFEGENRDFTGSSDAMDLWQTMGMVPANTEFG